jgi:hypothetical protein
LRLDSIACAERELTEKTEEVEDIERQFDECTNTFMNEKNLFEEKIASLGSDMRD